MERRTGSTFFAKVFSAGFVLVVLPTCAPTPEFKLNSSDSANFAHNGSTYTSQRDASGNLIVTASDGSSFTVDPNGNVTQAKAAGGARFTFTYNGQNISVTPFVPEYDGNSPPRMVIMDILPTAQAKASICDVISHGCEFLSNFVDNILPAIEPKIADRYAQEQGLPVEAVGFVIHGYIEDITNKIKNFCAGWGLLILANQNPCDEFAGQACPSVNGTWNLTYQNNPGHRMSVEANGASATATLEINIVGTNGGLIVADLTGTLSVGANSCPECVVFDGTWSSNITRGIDALQVNIHTGVPGEPPLPPYVPPNRPFSIVFDSGLRSAQGKLSEDGSPDLIISAERTDCN